MKGPSPRDRLIACIAEDLENRSGPSEALTEALLVISAITRSCFAIVPQEPNAAMVAAGVLAGGVSPDQARRTYTAMIGAAE
jgi:hypothetical protein